MKHAAIVLTAAALSGCAMFNSPPGTQLGDTWVKNHDALPFAWEVVPASEVAVWCDFKYEHPKQACAIRIKNGPDNPYCLIFAAIPAREAMNTYLHTPTGAIRSLDKKPETLWAHEVKHCNGYDHEVAK